jgi:hypothetical protein
LQELASLQWCAVTRRRQQRVPAPANLIVADHSLLFIGTAIGTNIFDALKRDVHTSLFARPKKR